MRGIYLSKLKAPILAIIFAFFGLLDAFAQEVYVTAKARRGDGVYSLLRRYELDDSSEYLNEFIKLNSKNLGKNNSLFAGREYKLPIKITQFNGRTIRSTLGIDSYKLAKRIQDYNDRLYKRKIRDKDFRVDKNLWIPVFMASDFSKEPLKSYVAGEYEIFGEKYKKVEPIDDVLDGYVYYLVAGHGGPDPGAVGKKDNRELHEDEYAYDVTLRLARRLLEHGAKVYVIVRDDEDGIRDDAYLDNSSDEYYFGGGEIPLDQIKRLKTRADIVNKLYRENKKTAKNQYAIVIHVDSRYVGKRIDIFFYHHEGSSVGKKTSETLLQTIGDRYEKAQPGRGYKGSVSTRSLYMLRATAPPCVYIELGNIQNPADQVRFIKADNRQAIANWLCDGLIEAAGE